MLESTYDFSGPGRVRAPVTGHLLAALVLGTWRVLTSLFAVQRTASPDARQANADAAAVRQMAQRYSHTDRGFAADLLAAADRHEEDVRARRPGSAADRRTA